MSDWRNELNGIMGSKAHASRAEQENAQFEKFLDEVAKPALEAVAEELTKNHGREAQVRRAPATVTLQVHNGTEEEITFRVMKQFVQSGILPHAEVRLNKSTQFVKYESMFKPDPPNYPISAVTQDEIIQCFIKYYGMVMGGPNA
jgi:hypothetical protein